MKIQAISGVIGVEVNYLLIKGYSKSKEKQQAYREKEDEICSFKPNLNKDGKYYEYVQSNYKFDEKIATRIKVEMKQKEDKIAEMKRYYIRINQLF